MRPTRAFAALALAASVSAQGSLGGSQGSCTTAQAWAYRGCYGDVANGANAGFTFKLVGSASPSDPNYYPGYTTGKVSVDICLQGCRGHGFRFAALHGATDCYCGTKKPTTQTLGSSTTSNATINECHVTSLGGCQGNTNQYCGSLAASDVYEDTSFPNVALAAQGGNYAYVGCITVISPGDFFYATTAANTAACQSACANLGYPFAGMSDKGGVTNACQCGTEIQKGSPASAGQSCLPCGGGDTGASCGGLVSGAPLITVYRNVNLQGCYSPQVPSSSATITSSSVMSTAPAATSSTPIVARDTTPRIDGRCGSAFGGATCDPAGVYGGCCSSGGYCGTTTAHCLVSNGCQSGCTASAATAPRADGRCGTAFGGATCDPAGAYGGCCSSGGYCGTTPAHCLTSNGCQLGCVNPATTTTTTITSTSSSSIISTSASSALGGTAPRTDGRCGLSFGGATCDPNGAYGGCCSLGGYCGTTTAHCLVSNGCQSGCTAVSSTAPRADGRCGSTFGGATCDPNGGFGGCCSAGGYCGSTPAHCLSSNGCQNGCSNPIITTTTTTSQPITTTTTTSTSLSLSSSSSSSVVSGAPPPRADGQCGSAFGGATCDPNGAYGGCCSQYGYCGATPGHCLVANGCQNGCSDGSPVVITTTTTTSQPVLASTSSSVVIAPTSTTSLSIITSTSSLSTTTRTTASSSSSSAVSVGSPPRADGQCGSAFGGATCDPNGAYGGCCSQYGYCGATPGHCLVANGCQNGCSDGPQNAILTTTTTTPIPTIITTTSRPIQITTTTTSSSGSLSSSIKSSTSSLITSSVVSGSSPPRTDGQCGSAFGGATCDPNGAYGGCCSQYGYCGATPGHCLVANGCQNGCSDGSPVVTTISSSSISRSSVSSSISSLSTSSLSSLSSSTLNIITSITTLTSIPSTSISSSSSAALGGSPPRPDGQCGSAFGGATCDPNGAYGGCCSQYGYCGASPGHCLVANGCQNGCSDGSPVIITTSSSLIGSSTPGTILSTTSTIPSSSSTLPSSSLNPTVTTSISSSSVSVSSLSSVSSSSSASSSSSVSSSPSVSTVSSSFGTSSSSAAAPAGSAPPRTDGQCGQNFGGATCDPNGAYGGCCSQYGYCGATPGHCLVANGCQNGCSDGPQNVILTTTSSSSSSSVSSTPNAILTSTRSSSATSNSVSTPTATVVGSSAPRADGRCGFDYGGGDFGGATCDPNGAYGGCCSLYGYCGTTPGHCLKTNGCQNGCSDGPDSPSPAPLISSTISSSSTVVSSSTSQVSTSISATVSTSSLVLTSSTSGVTTPLSSSTLASSTGAATAPRADGRCGYDYGGGDFGGATCDPNGAYGGCCSLYGYCGTTPGHCLKTNGCQNGCSDGPDSPSPSPTAPTTVLTASTSHSPTASSLSTTSSASASSTSNIILITTSRTSTSSSSSLSSSSALTSSAGAATAPRADGRCGYDYGGGDFGGATCDANGVYGGCCSQYGYCGATPGHCLKTSGCQNGCSDGPDSPSPAPLTTISSTFSSSSTVVSSSSSVPISSAGIATSSSTLSTSRSSTTSTIASSGTISSSPTAVSSSSSAPTSSAGIATSSSTLSTSGSSTASTVTSSGTVSGSSTAVSSQTSSSTFSTSSIAPSSAPRNDGRCGTDFGGATCDPLGPYGGCCSSFGYCGSSQGHCDVANGCQNGCNGVTSTSTATSGSSTDTTVRSTTGTSSTATGSGSGTTGTSQMSSITSSMDSGDIGPHSTHTITRTTTKDGTTFTLRYTETGTATQTTSINQTITATSIVVQTLTVTQTATQNQTITREPATTWWPNGATITPGIIPNVGGYAYLGCYGELGRDPKNTLSDDFYSVSQMTLEICGEYCGEYSYFGLEGGTHCYCGGTINNGAEVIDEAWCDATCEGNRTEICGGYQALDIYERVSGSSPTTVSNPSSPTSNPTSSTVSEPTGTSSCSNGDSYLSPEGVSYTQACNTYYYGDESAQGVVGSVEECAQKCDTWNEDTRNPPCLAALFSKTRQDNNCWVKTSNQGTVSSGTFDTFIRTGGASSISSTSTSSAASSTALSSTAVSSTTVSSTTVSSTTVSSTGSPSPTPTSASLSCYDGSSNGSVIITPSGHHYERECATYYYGSEQRVGRTILSLDSCAQQCDGYNSAPNDESGPCLGVLFYPQRDGGQCWLKFAIGNSLSSADLGQGGPVDAALWVDRPASSSTIAASSTNPASPTGTPCQNGTTYLSEAGHHYLEICGTYYYGTEPKADYADNIEQCAEMCDQYNSNKPQDLCIGAIFLADETICYLKTSLTGSVEVTSWATLILLDSSPASSTTASSAIPTSTRAPCVNGSIFTVPDGRRFQTLCHLDWNSDGIYYTFVDSLESCAAQCADYNTGGVEQPCVGVSFVPDRQGVNCYLKYGFDNLVLDWPFEVDSALLLPEDNGTSSSTTSSSTTSSLTSSPSSSPSPTTFSTIGCPSAVTLTQTAVTVTKPAVTVTVTVGC